MLLIHLLVDCGRARRLSAARTRLFMFCFLILAADYYLPSWQRATWMLGNISLYTPVNARGHVKKHNFSAANSYYEWIGYYLVP